MSAIHPVKKAAEVYGISRELPLNYVVRKSADERLLSSLTRDKHLVIYGSSKQGKTSLRKHCLQDSDYIVVQCSNKWSIEDINAAVLKQAGFELTQSTKTTVQGKAKLHAKIGLTLFGKGVEGGGEGEASRAKEVVKAGLDLDPADVNDIIAALQQIGFSKFIVLEDFHYLQLETQKDFSIALKAFHENSKFCFIIVGVWLEENRLTTFNGDLDGRVASINADHWDSGELEDVISTGETLLNISFTKEFKLRLLQNCYDSVYVVQEVCYRACDRSKIYETQTALREIGGDLDAAKIVKEVVDAGKGRFHSFINLFSEGFQTTELQMYRWILYPLLTAKTQDLEKGLKFSLIRATLQEVHPQRKELNPGNISQALHSSASLQVKKGIKPIIIDYDTANTVLRVVDKSFLIWLAQQDRNELLELAGLPKSGTGSDPVLIQG